MKTESNFLAFDLGASSGRAVLGFLEKNKLTLQEINRFSNGPVELDGTLYWDFMGLWANIVESLKICAQRGYEKLSGIGVDTWGVDFGLLGADGKLLGWPVCYRDSRTTGIEKIIASAIKENELYQLTGAALNNFFTLAQLTAVKRGQGSDVLKITKTLLLMPDIFRYLLCGEKGVELSIAGTTQLANVRTAKWCPQNLQSLKSSIADYAKDCQTGHYCGQIIRQALRTERSKRSCSDYCCRS